MTDAGQAEVKDGSGEDWLYTAGGFISLNTLANLIAELPPE